MPDEETDATVPDVPARRDSERLEPQRRSARKTGDRFVLGEALGRGGMGEVLDARDEQIGRTVAIKRMLADAPTDAQMQRFLREAKIQGQLEHPAIVPVHELGRDTDGRPYFAMKKLAGTTLADIVDLDDGTKYPRNRLLRAFSDVCLAIELAHTRGIVHRDLKPSNIMLGDFGETYVLDWGVAKVLGESSDVALDVTDSANATRAGAAIGTPGYMAPEQARGEKTIGPRADIYALGCVLFEILAGDRLHPRGEAGLVMTLEQTDARPSSRAPDREIPPELDALCVEATQLDPANRISSARELGERVQRFLDGDRDLELRRTIARQHLDAANAALAAGDRKSAMREAGRALAFDSTLSEAAQVITTMLVEPPREPPPEVVSEMAKEDEGLVRSSARVGAIANSIYVLLVPMLLIAGSVPLLYSLAISALAVLGTGYLMYMARPGGAYRLWPIALVDTLLLVVVARLLSPFVFGIAASAVTVVGLMAGPAVSLRRGIAVATMLSLAVLLPWLGEQVGWLSSTIDVARGEMTLRSPLYWSPAMTHLALVLATIVGTFAALALTRQLRFAERDARLRMHMQAWQLRQLVS
ncbi:MAG TPA: serine/threonine-protein kinase [Kofleriaceae bacterium]|nr:serine/threonine-protein kinase [Kofleriaceae bacterium]